MPVAELPVESVPRGQWILDEAFIDALKPAARAWVARLDGEDPGAPLRCVEHLLRQSWVRGWADVLGEHFRRSLLGYVADLVEDRWPDRGPKPD